MLFRSVGNRVRVMRDGQFLIAKELPRSKTRGAKTDDSGKRTEAAQDFALEFDGVQSCVETPLKLGREPKLTIEAWSVPRGETTQAVVCNFEYVGAATNFRFLNNNQPELPERSPIELYSLGNQALFRNIEIREINALPPEILMLQ